MLGQLLAADLFLLVLVFARVGGAIMLLPGFGEVFVSPRVRLMLALAVTLVVTPAVSETLPREPDGLFAAFVLIAGEAAVGLFIGALARMMVAALHAAGVIIGFQTSLGNAQLFDPVNAMQGSLIGSFLNVLGVFLIFAADLHHLLLLAVADSYTLFVPGQPLPLGHFSAAGVEVLGRSFVLAMQLAAPFVVMAMLFYLGLGLLARLMPQVQIFFIAIPVQLALGFLVMAMTLSAMMIWFLGAFENIFVGILLPG